MKITKSFIYEGGSYTHLSDDSRSLDANTLYVKTITNAPFRPPHPSIEASQLADIFAPLPHIIGITGTNGKTTTAAIIYSLLLDLSYSCALIGTRGVFANDKQIRPKGLTTPCALELYEIFDAVRGCEFVIMEVSSHAIAQERIAGLSFHTKILTNITSDHLDYHRTHDEYIRVKNSFFTDGGRKIINADEKRARYNAQNVYTYAIESKAMLKPNAYSLDAAIIAHLRYTPPLAKRYAPPLTTASSTTSHHITPATPTASKPHIEQALMHCALYGKHNLYNILAALLCVRLITERPLASIATYVEGFGGVEGRMEVVSHDPLIIVDFAHTHDGLEAVFTSFIGREIIVVFGAGGDRDKSKRAKMGAIAYKYATQIYITSDNPRSEDPQAIITDILQGIPPHAQQRVICEVDRKKAIRQAVLATTNNNVLLVLGKGDERYQIIGQEQRYFDDREEIKNALQEKHA